MKMKTRYLILFIIDVLLIILWPIAAAMTPAKWYAFIAGAFWLSDWTDAVRHWKGYKAYKAMGE
jgi:hypothetical protein